MYDDYDYVMIKYYDENNGGKITQKFTVLFFAVSFWVTRYFIAGTETATRGVR